MTVLVAGDGFRTALDFTTGVLSLVALTCSVVWGLVASDRLFLSSRQRLLAQGVHRATAVASIGFLLLHGTVKIALDHVSLLGALVPFSLGVRGTSGLIGFGSLAGLLMVATGVTGALRSAFASPARVAGRWRALHMLAYPAWCSALVHGLYAGREPKPWVVTLYCLCLAAVAGAIALRSAPLPIKRKVAARILALLRPVPDAASARSPQEPPARRTAPLPGLAAAETPPELSELPSQLPPRHGPFEPPSPGLYEALPQALGSGPSGPTGMAAAYRAVSAAPGARPAPEPRWPAPSPPLPTEAHSATDEPPGYAPVAYDPYDTGATPTYQPVAYDPCDTGGTPAYDPYSTSNTASTGSTGSTGSSDTPLYDSLTDTTPLPGTPPAPFQPPSAGSPWTTPSTPSTHSATGGRR
ncbi:cytochrome b/b6 domain-containing protein [Streptomyces sp. NBC_01304]|uniref:cytochrome b/b6 domain-containing protein n=1 Tax=Streptomyces sp. NBC_01304 TaxID=2903818 RepID=UPI002E10677A|nr:cytochrome b/b6 domain-containing protein [Streptomyces sp. NBC_01304]